MPPDTEGVNYSAKLYESIGKKVEVLTLSNGQYQEIFPNDTLVRIGSVLFNTVTQEVVEFVEKSDADSYVAADVASRFLSVDPIGRQYPELTPYQFASNTPIQAIDLDGLEGQFFFSPNTAKQSEATGQATSIALQKGWEAAKRWWNTPNKTASGIAYGYQQQMGVNLGYSENRTNGDAVIWGLAQSAQSYGNYASMQAGLEQMNSKTPQSIKSTEATTFRGHINEDNLNGNLRMVEQPFTITLRPRPAVGEEGGPKTTIFEITLPNQSPKYVGEATLRYKTLSFFIKVPDELKNSGIGSTIFATAIGQYKPNKIKGNWINSPGINDNFKAFKSNIAAKMSETNAALNTPTGRMAQKNGYTVPNVTSNSENHVTVEFTKPK